MQEWHLILTAEVHVLFPESGVLILVLFNHGLERAFFINVVLYFFWTHFDSQDFLHQPLVFGEQTDWERGSYHNVRSFSYLLSVYLFCLLFIVHSGRSVERLFLHLDVILVRTLILRRISRVSLNLVNLLLLESFPFWPRDILRGVVFSILVMIMNVNLLQLEVPVLVLNLFEALVDEPLMDHVFLRCTYILLASWYLYFFAQRVKIFEGIIVITLLSVNSFIHKIAFLNLGLGITAESVNFL